MKTALFKQGHTCYYKQDGTFTHAYFWIKTEQDLMEYEFNLMFPSTMGPGLEAFWAEVRKSFDRRSAKMTYDRTRITLQYLTTENKAVGYANPLF